jgi:hypothetical protein
MKIMKKVIFSILIAGFALSATAQVGIKAGLSFATIAERGEDFSFDDVESNAIIAPVIGLTFDLNLSDIITIQPELIYTQLGGKNTYNVLGVENVWTYRMNYLELPVLAKVTFGNADRTGFGFYLAAGPWIGYALSGKYNQVLTSNGTIILEAEQKNTFDDLDDTGRLNYGMIGAVGLSFGKAVLDVRYNYGFNNILDDDADNDNDNSPVRQTRGVALTLGYTF